MAYFIVIRGPAGIGKSTLSKELTKILKANPIHFDKVMSKHKLDIIDGGGISAKNFVKANKLVLKKALSSLKKEEVVIFDGCFYREEQIKHLLENLPYKSYIFSLKAPVNTCVSRNKTRSKDMSDEAIHEVYNLVFKYEFGIPVETHNKTIEQVTKEILGHIRIKS